MEVDASSKKDALLRFDVSGIGGASVASATLRLFAVDPSSFGGEFFKVTTNTPWSEDTVTWGNAPAGDGGSLGTLSAVEAGNWYELDVTPLVTGDGPVSIRGTSTNPNGADYASKENPNLFAPELIVELGPEASTSLAEAAEPMPVSIALSLLLLGAGGLYVVKMRRT